MDKTIAKRHFSQFGKIHSFILRPKRFSCTIEYESETAAGKCVEDGYYYENEIFDIVYTPKSSPKLRSDPDYIDPDVQMELDAMGPTVQFRLPTQASRLHNGKYKTWF